MLVLIGVKTHEDSDLIYGCYMGIKLIL